MAASKSAHVLLLATLLSLLILGDSKFTSIFNNFKPSTGSNANIFPKPGNNLNKPPSKPPQTAGKEGFGHASNANKKVADEAWKEGFAKLDIHKLDKKIIDISRDARELCMKLEYCNQNLTEENLQEASSQGAGGLTEYMFVYADAHCKYEITLLYIVQNQKKTVHAIFSKICPT